MIPVDPLLSVQIEDSEVGLKGFVALHNLGSTGASGGFRCAADITADEVRQLARAMAYKHAFFKQRQGGAKGGMVMDCETGAQRRQELVRCMGKHLELLLRSGAYHAWTDMNFGPSDVVSLYAGAGINRQAFADSSGQRTALSALASLSAAVNVLGTASRRYRVTIEGFGSVGGLLAQELVRSGGCVVAVSNEFGAVANNDGLQVDQLIERRKQNGARFILESGNWRNVSCKELFDIEADVLVPCARVGSLNGEIARRTPVRAVVPVANMPCTSEAEQILADRGIILLPDFVVNAGGILGFVSASADGRAFFLTEYRDMVKRLLQMSKTQGRSPADIARKVADKNFDAMEESFLRPRPFTETVFQALQRRGIIPKRHTRHVVERCEKLNAIVCSYFRA